MISLASIKSDTFLLVWNIASVVTFLLPLFAFTTARLTTYGNEDENQNGNQNNQYQSNYENPDYYDEYGNYVGPNHWWEFWKKTNNRRNGNEENEDELSAPWWYIWGEREGREPEEESRAVLFVYLWSLALLACIAYVGNTCGTNVIKLEKLRVILLGFANCCFVTIILLVGSEDTIRTEGREIEETGFYGQRAVLLFLTCIFGLLQSIVFVSWTSKRIKKLKIDSLTGKSDEYVNVEFDNAPPAGSSGPSVPV